MSDEITILAEHLAAEASKVLTQHPALALAWDNISRQDRAAVNRSCTDLLAKELHTIASAVVVLECAACPSVEASDRISRHPDGVKFLLEAHSKGLFLIDTSDTPTFAGS